jgi:hypothetical protein
MKKIINGKLYDTETATKLGTLTVRCNIIPQQSFTLYRTRKGTYFLCIISLDAETGESFPEIEILSKKEAREWAEECLTADEYCQIFGEPEEG